MPAGITLFPGALDSHSGGSPRGFAEAVNQISVQLTSGINNVVTTIPVNTTAGFPGAGHIAVDTEIIFYASKDATNFLTAVRGSDGTSAASHLNGASVTTVPTAATHNDLAAAIVALETKLGTGASTAAAAQVMRGTGPGTSAFGAIQPTDLPSGLLQVANLLTNGDMAIDRNVGPYTVAATRNNDGSQVLSGWYLLSDGNNIVSVAQDTAIANIPTGSRAALKATVVTTNKKFGVVKFLTRAQAMQILSGTASLRFKARTHATNIIANMRVGILTWSGTAEAYTLDVVNGVNWGAVGVTPTLAANWTYENAPANLALTSAWQTFDVAAAAIDTASGANVAVFFWSDDTTTSVGDELWLSDVNLVPGATALDIAYRPIGQESRLCGQSVSVAYAGSATASAAFVDIPNATVTLNTYGGDLVVQATTPHAHSVANGFVNQQILIDGVAVGITFATTPIANYSDSLTSVGRLAVAPGSHTVKVQFCATVVGGTDTTGAGTLVVVEE